MKPNFTVLENRVQKVVRQLCSVTEERDRLRAEVDPLRKELAAMQLSEAEAAPSGHVVPADRDRRLEQVERVLGEAVQELRGD